MVAPKFRAWFGSEMYDEPVVYEGDFNLDLLDFENDQTYDGVALMQSTGLFDKNGVEIFEKDIIKNKDGRLAIVKWHASYASFVYIWLDELKKEKQDWQPLYLAYMKFEIIGNVYENPELLEDT